MLLSFIVFVLYLSYEKDENKPKEAGLDLLKKDNNNNAADCKLCTLPKEILQG